MTEIEIFFKVETVPVLPRKAKLNKPLAEPLKDRPDESSAFKLKYVLMVRSGRGGRRGGAHKVSI